MLNTPKWLVPTDVIYRLGGDGGIARVSGLYSRVLGGLINDGRIDRMRASMIRQGNGAYKVEEMMDTLRNEVR